MGDGRAYLNMGTGIASGVISEQYQADRAFRTLNAPIPGAFFLEHILRGGVFTVAWFVEKFAADLQGVPNPAQRNYWKQRRPAYPPGSQGLMLVPYWNSVMNPYWDPSATGITIGWTGDHIAGAYVSCHPGRRGIRTEAGGRRNDGERPARRFVNILPWAAAVAASSGDTSWPILQAFQSSVRRQQKRPVWARRSWRRQLAAGIPTYARLRTAMTSTTDRIEPDADNQAVYDELYHEVYQPLFPNVATAAPSTKALV